MKTIRKIFKLCVIKETVIYVMVWCMLFNVPLSMATPALNSVVTGATVSGGGNTTTVNMTNSKAIIKWNSLDTSTLETLKFNGSGGFYALNRVVSGGATQFKGHLDGGNGNIFIVNQKGIVFGPTAVINAGTLTASALNINDDDFLNPINNTYKFMGGEGAVINKGAINADGVALIGRMVQNTGTITNTTGGTPRYVAMIAGDRAYITQSGSNIAVETSAVASADTIHTGPDGVGDVKAGDVINTGTITSPDGRVVLASGDIYSTALNLYGKASTGTVGIGNIKQNGTITADGEGSNVALYANDSITIDGAITTGGSMQLIADCDHFIAGHKDEHDFMHSNAPLTAGGSISISGNDILLGDTVTAERGDITITGRQCDTDTTPEWGNVWAKKTLTAGGNVTISTTGDQRVWVPGHWEYVNGSNEGNPGGGNGNGNWNQGNNGNGNGNNASGNQGNGVGEGMAGCGDKVWVDGHYEHTGFAPGTITLDGDVTAIAGNISLFNDTYTGNGVTLKAGQNILLQNGGDVTDPVGYPGYCSKLTGTHALTLWAGNEIVAPDTTISVTASSLTMHQGLDLNLKDYTFANQSGTNLTLISDNGSVTADMTKAVNAADKWLSIGATANQDITLVGDGGSIKLGDSGTDSTKSLWAKNGNIDVAAGYNVIANKDITADNGNVNIEAKHGIKVQNVSSGGDMTLHADTDNYWGQNVIAHGNLEAIGTMYIEGTNVNLQSADSGGDMTLYAHGLWRLSHPGDQIVAGGDVDVAGHLNSGGNITVTAVGFTGTPSTIGPDLDGSSIAYDSTGNISVGGTVNAGGSIYMNAGNGIKLGDTATAQSDIDLNADGTQGVATKSLKAENGYVNVHASNGNINVDGTTDAGDYIDMYATGDITLADTAAAQNDIGLYALNGVTAKGDLASKSGNIDITALGLGTGETIYLGGNVTAYGNVSLNNNAIVNGSGTQTIEAQTGTLTAQGCIHKTTDGDMWLLGGLDGPFDNLADSIVLNGDVSTSLGNLWIVGQNNLQINGDLTTFGEWDSSWWEGPFFSRPTGGVAVVSGSRIYTNDDSGTLNVHITGSSDHFAQRGIYDASIYGVDYNPGESEELAPRAAIAIVSNDTLKIGKNGSLNAYGTYYEDGSVDDRAAIGFLDVPADIPAGVARNQGVPFDLAIYAASRTGNVAVDAPVSIQSNQLSRQEETSSVSNGAMVVDAFDTVSFGSNFTDSLSQGFVGDRLEVCSRITEWLNQAIDNATLPFADGSAPIQAGYNYVLRGAGLANPQITDDGRAWVLERNIIPPPVIPPVLPPVIPPVTPPVTPPLAAPVPSAAPLSNLFTKVTIDFGGCPTLLAWLAGEVGSTSDKIQLRIASTFDYAAGTHPCDSCSKLKDAAAMLTDDARIAALAKVVNGVVATPGPITEEQMAMIASNFANHTGDGTYYAQAGEWIDALAKYVGVLNKDLKYSPDQSLAFANKYYGSQLDGKNAELAAYVAARVAALGTSMK